VHQVCCLPYGDVPDAAAHVLSHGVCAKADLRTGAMHQDGARMSHDPGALPGLPTGSCAYHPQGLLHHLPHGARTAHADDTQTRCRMVPEIICRQVPVTTCRMVSEPRQQVIKCQRTKMVPEVCSRTVPVTTCKMVQEVCTRTVPVTTCQMVPYTWCETRCRKVAVRVPECCN